MTTLQLLKGVKKILNSPKRWIKFDLENEGSDGKPSYCLVGAIGKFVNDNALDYDGCLSETAQFARALNIKGSNLHNFQDKLIDYNNRESLTYSDMIKRINLAIERLTRKN